MIKLLASVLNKFQTKVELLSPKKFLTTGVRSTFLQTYTNYHTVYFNGTGTGTETVE